jgi:hypothetical protein
MALSGPDEMVCCLSAVGGKADVHGRMASPASVADDPKLRFAAIN